MLQYSTTATTIRTPPPETTTTATKAAAAGWCEIIDKNFKMNIDKKCYWKLVASR